MRISNPHIPLTITQHSALTGSMLGDGHLSLKGKSLNANLMIGRTTLDKEYLEYEASIFYNFQTPKYKKHGLYYVKNKGTYNFATIASPIFTEYHKVWYPNNKRIPSNLELNSQIVAHWLADDAHISYNKLPYRFIIEISTHGFTKQEVEFLAHLLYKKYREEFLVKSKKKNKFFYIIKCYDSACRAIFHDIDLYFKMSRKRIWDKPDSRFYFNPPARQYKKVKNFLNRKELIKQIIQEEKNFTLLQLSQRLGYPRLYYADLNKLLQPYIDQGIILKEFDKLNNNLCTIIVKEQSNEFF